MAAVIQALTPLPPMPRSAKRQRERGARKSKRGGQWGLLPC